MFPSPKYCRECNSQITYQDYKNHTCPVCRGDKMITVKEAASIINCSQRRVRQLVEEGKLKAEKKKTKGGKPYYAIDRKSVEEFASEPQKQGPKRGESIVFHVDLDDE